MSSSERVFIGVDAGGTNTRSVLTDEQGNVLARGSAGPANHRTASRESAAQAVRQAISSVLLGRDRVTAVGIGWSGLEAPGSAEDAMAIVGDAVHTDCLVLDSDVYAAQVGAFEGGPGLLVSAGTGSMVLGVDQAGNRVRAGGWGYLYGDEGSANWIAREAIRAALMSVDGRAQAERLWRALLEHVVGDVAGKPLEAQLLDVTSWLYSPGRHVSEVAAFARAVHELAREGDEASRQILVRAGRGLAELVLACTRKAADDSLRVVAGSGSVWRDNEIVRESCIAALHESGIEFSFTAPVMEPELGAALMAMQESF